MPEALRVLIADDEAPARTKLRRLLEADPRFTLIGEARDGLEALAHALHLKPQVFILDIQMPGLTGFDVVASLPDPMPHIVFSTAYDRYALDAFEAAAVDYLLKPYDGDRFRRAMDRVVALQGAGAGRVMEMVQTIAPTSQERLLVEGSGGLEALPMMEILRVEADGKGVRVLSDRGAFLLRGPMREVERRLPSHRFCRVHRSTLVALEAVVRLEPWDHGDGLLILRDGSHCVLSRTYRGDFLSRWGV